MIRNSHLRWLWLLALGPITNCNCGEDLGYVPGTLRGQFCDPDTGAGIGRVEVSVTRADDGTALSDLATVGDANGVFEIKGLNPGAYVIAGTLGSITRTRETQITSDSVTEFIDAACHDPPPPPPPTGGKVVGQECNDGVGSWLAFAQVWLSSPGNAGEVLYPAVTDVDGRYEIVNVAPGTYDLHLYKDAYSRDIANVVVMEGAQFDVPGPATCQPPPGGVVEGQICRDGVGWVDAARAWINLNGGEVLEATTDAQGHFSIANVPPGDHVVRVEKDLFFRSWLVTVISGGTVQVPGPATCDPVVAPPETGTVVGRVCAPDGRTWLAGARVLVGDPNNPLVETSTDADGNFTLTGVPEGQQTVTVIKNSFTATYSVTVTANGTITIPVDQCAVVPTATRVAVLSGLYDNVRCVLTGSSDPLASRPGDACTVSGLGLDPSNVTTVNGTASGWASSFLGNFATMSQYDIIFFNCGVADGSATTGANAGTYAANLRQYVEQGGSIYASDWAAPLIELAFPEFITWQNGTPQNDNVQTAKVGNPQTVSNAAVTDPGIRAALGQNTVAISYDLPAWVAMQSTAPATRVYIRGTASGTNASGFGNVTMSNIPFTVGFDVGQGRVVYTSFHQERNLTPDMLAVLNLLVFEL